MRGKQIILSIFVAALAAAGSVRAQCDPVWSSLDGLRGRGPEALAVHDEDGPGAGSPALFVSGGLGEITTIARWDGWEASTVGDGPHETFWGLDTMGSVPEGVGAIESGLYVGGDITLAGGPPVNTSPGGTASSGTMWVAA